MSETLSLLGTSAQAESQRHYLSTSSVSMLAIGGTIGTGLFFSVATLVSRGPLMALASMLYVAFIVVLVLEVTAELAVFFPGSSSICHFQFLFLGRSAGLANSVIYWLSWGLTYALELSIATNICSFWAPEFVEKHQKILILSLWAILTAFNLLPVDIYGEIEFWISLVKVLAIIAWVFVIFTSLVSKSQFFYVWLEDWPASFVGEPASALKHIVAFCNCLVFSSFIFQSVESIAITTGDIAEPHKTIPKVTKIIFVRIVVFYLVSVFLLTVSVSYSDTNLHHPSVQNPLSSPFLIAMVNCGFSDSGMLLSAFNIVVLSAIISAANSNVYFGSRFLDGMIQAHGPHTKLRFLTRKNHIDVPVAAVLATSSFGLFALLSTVRSFAVFFNFLVTCCASAGMLMWLLLCASHIRFSKALKAQGRSRKSLVYCSKWRLEYWAWFAAINLAVVLLMSGLTVYWDFSWTALIGSYMTPLAFIILWGFCGGLKEQRERPMDIDLSQGLFNCTRPCN